MRRAVITGATGFMGHHLIKHIEQAYDSYVLFDRTKYDSEDERSVFSFLTKNEITDIFHLAKGTVKFTQNLAKWAARKDANLVIASTSLVWDVQTTMGPFIVDDEPNSPFPMGQHRIACENAALELHPKTKIARFGWQFSEQRGGDNMFEHFARLQEMKGYVPASKEWKPACSHIEDTCAALVTLMQDDDISGVTLFDGNAELGMSMFELATVINDKLNCGWDVREEHEGKVENNLMLDERIKIHHLISRL